MDAFLKKNKAIKENAFFPASQDFCDEKGDPLLWEIRAVPTTEDKRLRKSCTTEVPVTGKPGVFREKTDVDAYTAKLMAASVVFPDLYDAELQDSYGVKTPEALLEEMLDATGEHHGLLMFIQQHSGLDISMSDKIKEAKN